MLDKEDVDPADAGGCGLSSSGVASPSLKVILAGIAVFLSSSSELLRDEISVLFFDAVSIFLKMEQELQ